MALSAIHKETQFGVGDVVRVHQKVVEGEKSRTQVFEGTVIGIKGHGNGKSFTVRRIGAQKIGIEQIYPLNTPAIDKIEVVKEGMPGVKQSKLYYIRDKSRKEIDKIYARAKRKNSEPIKKTKKISKSKTAVKKTAKKAVKK